MRLARARTVCTHLAVAAAFVAMGASGDLPLWSQLLFFGVLLASLLKGERGPAWLPPLLNAATAGTGLVLVLLWSRGGLDGVVAAAVFGAVLAGNRVLARRSAADDFLIYFTSLLMLAGGAALTGELLYGACFAVYGLAVTVGLALSHLDREADAARLGPGARERQVVRPLLLALLGLAALSLLASTAFFVSFPRVNARWLARRPGLGRNPMIGFAGRVELGGHGLLRDDPRPALRVTLPEGLGAPGAALPEELSVLWRAQSLSSFDGRGWSGATKIGYKAPRSAEPAGFTGLHARIEVLPVANTDAIFSPGELAAVALLGPRRMGEPPRGVRVRGSGDALVIPRPDGAYTYEVWGKATEASPALRGLGTDYPEAVAGRDLQLPAGLDPRIPALARDWTRGQTDPYEKARAIRDHLREDFRYSTQLPGDVPDPLAHFLFERKEGHCEFFSTAMVVLLRAAGVPAREVTGFSGGIRSPGGDYYLVRAGDAHSWAEVYFPGQGYVAFDPTPPSFREAEPSGVRAWLAAAVDVLDRRWQSEVIDYDLGSQIQAVRRLFQAANDLGEGLSRPSAPGALPPVGPLLAGLGLALVGAALWRRRRRRADPAADPEAVRAYRELLARLGKRGVPRQGAETPREYAARLSQLGRPEAPAAAELTELYERARYAGAAWGEAERDRAKALLERVA